ncbi:MAG: hypothetical protein ACKVJW_05535 [Flavobacteriales bacterium]|tara:strand:+ start:119 stop:694 length:576 start_codon:yes stop_codon:yes gene_type:complete
MKNLMKTSIYLLSFNFLLASCGGESSTKGNWKSNDMDRCTSDMISEMKDDPESENILSLTGFTLEEFAACACEKVSQVFDSYSIADADESMNEEEAGMLILSCFGDMEDLIKLGMEMEDESTSEENEEEFSEEFINEFMENCSGDDLEMIVYCDCMLTQLMLNYTVEEMEILTEEDMIKMDGFDDCVSLFY